MYKCAKCGKKYNRKISYYHHTKYYCGLDAQFQCLANKCCYKARLKADLRKHILKHKDLSNEQKHIIIEKIYLKRDNILD